MKLAIVLVIFVPLLIRIWLKADETWDVCFPPKGKK